MIEEGFPVSSVIASTRKRQEAARLAKKVVPNVAWEEVMVVWLHRETHVMGVFHDLPCLRGSVVICLLMDTRGCVDTSTWISCARAV